MKPISTWHIFVDGASRNNPGNAGAGIYIKKNDSDFKRVSVFLKTKTNNEAEYLALVIAILLIKDTIHTDDIITITSDSLLLVHQLNGRYAVKKAELKIFHSLIKKLLDGHRYVVKHVLREHNKIADSLANKAIDDKLHPDKHLTTLLQQHEVTI